LCVVLPVLSYLKRSIALFQAKNTTNLSATLQFFVFYDFRV